MLPTVDGANATQSVPDTTVGRKTKQYNTIQYSIRRPESGCTEIIIPVVPPKAVAEVSKIENL